MECDGGDPDCADGTDESPRVCGTTTAAAATTPVTPGMPATPAPDTSSGGTGMTTTIAYTCAALLIVGALVVAWRHNSGETVRANDGGGGQGVSMNFANPGFQAPRPTATEDDGELYEDSAPPQPHYDEAGPGQPGAQPSYSEVGDGTAAAAPRAGSVVNQSYAHLPTVSGPAGTSEMPQSSSTSLQNSGKAAAGGTGDYDDYVGPGPAVKPADMHRLDSLPVAAPSKATAAANGHGGNAYDLGTDDPASTYDLGSGGHYDLGGSGAGQGVTTYGHDDSMSEEEI